MDGAKKTSQPAGAQGSPGPEVAISPDDSLKLEPREEQAGVRKSLRPDGNIECEIG
jgi:hypothetical protein